MFWMLAALLILSCQSFGLHLDKILSLSQVQAHLIYMSLTLLATSPLLNSPRSVVWSDLVEVCDGHGILGLLLVIAHAAVLESVAPQDLIWQIGRPHLKIIYLHLPFLTDEFQGQPQQKQGIINILYIV